ncbi:hypothetical protein [Amycolatopsis sp. NPDC059021]|uniref:hypothetical protein n=1 Tax=Amycolatopsis sp. NPDC059021 TaxID=3346704 RepID=UPI0036724260
MKLCRGRNIRPRVRANVRDAVYNVGLERGWDAANYAEAYGGDPEEGIDNHVDSKTDGFKDGFREGIARFQRGEFPDGQAIS